MVACHLIPRRIDDAGVQSVIHRVSGSSTLVDRYDPTIGVFLLSTWDILADGYQLRFGTMGL